MAESSPLRSLQSGPSMKKSQSTNDLDEGLAERLRQSLRMAPKTPRKKYRWFDGKGRQLTAGGILPYDDEGIWVIGERDKSGLIYTDAGGKYQFEDGDVFKTIARELGEETYHTCEMTRSQVLDLYNTYQPVYVNGHKNRPVYICLVVPTTALPSLEFDETALSAKFEKARQEVLKGNPMVPPDHYRSAVIQRLTFKRIGAGEYRLSYRLKRVLRYGPLSDRIPTLSLLSDTPPPDDEE